MRMRGGLISRSRCLSWTAVRPGDTGSCAFLLRAAARVTEVDLVIASGHSWGSAIGDGVRH
jgi:hypothetical protein